MGSILSNLSTQSLAVVIILVGATSYTVVQRVLTASPSSSAVTPASDTSSAGMTASGKKGKKKKGSALQPDAPGTVPSQSTVTPNVVPFPAVIPGSFEFSVTASPQEHDDATLKPTKPKKKKAKKANTPVIGGGTRSVPLDAQSESSATAPESHTSGLKGGKKKSPTPKLPSVSLIDTDDTWTRVEPRRRGNASSPTAAHGRETSGAQGSDAGVSTSATGNSSPVTERTEDEAHHLPQDNRRTLAERLLPKPRKTAVDDMLETPDQPALARVMRVQPRADEQPAVGFTWADYEDVDDPRTADDADGEDEGGWVVKASRSRPKLSRPSTSEQQAQAQRAPEALTKKQRQNAAKREAQKSAKIDAEAERLAALAKHKRELERTRMLEQSSKNTKVSGGMSASINEKGHLVWD